MKLKLFSNYITSENSKCYPLRILLKPLFLIPFLLFSSISISSPVVDAARDGRYDLLKTLIEQGSPVDQVENSRSPTALILVILKNDFDIAKYLINKGANVNAIHPATHCSALQLAAATDNKKSSIPIVKLLVKNGANINHSSKLCAPAIIEASIAGNLNVVEFLHKNQANLNLQHSNSYALYEAALNGHKNLTRWLLENGANPNLKSRDDSTALHIIAQNLPELYEPAINKGGQATLDKQGQGVITYAIKGNHPNLIQFRLKSNPSQKELDDGLRTATALQNKSLVLTLLRHGANPEARNHWGDNALSISEKIDDENIRKLIKRKTRFSFEF